MSTNHSRIRAVGLALIITSTAGWAATTTVATAPTVAPAPIIEKPLAQASNDLPSEQPSSQHVWVPGHWRWHEGAYVWEAGRWEVPPTVNVAWHPPEWQQQANGFVLREGYWAEPAPTTQVVTSPDAKPQTPFEVPQPPPPLQRETIPERPSGSHVWLPGYWSWANGGHVWMKGEWKIPPRDNVTWVAPRWEMRNNRYTLVEGFWREAVAPPRVSPPPVQTVVAAPPAPAQQVIVVTPPPPIRQEVVYARPTPRHVWVPGFWSWQGNRYVWMAGHYALPPRGRDRWVEPRWERRGANYVFVEGHWR